jgi:dTDP-4-dehydrorhamnose reductase
MSTLLLGGGGFVGGYLLRGLTRYGYSVDAPTRSELDVTDTSTLTRYLDRGYDTVINCAARIHTDGYSEEEIRAINSTPSEIISRYSTYYVYVSTASVFSNGTYGVSDIPNPNTMYGMSKLEGEAAILASSKDYMIVRAPSIFGGHTKTLPYRVLSAADTNQAVQGTDKLASYMLIDILVDSMLDLIGTYSTGLYHISSSDYGTYYEFLSYVLKVFGYDTKVELVTSEDRGIVLLPSTAAIPWRYMVDMYYSNCKGDWRI